MTGEQAQKRATVIQLAVASLRGALGEIKFDCRTKGAAPMVTRQLIARVEDAIRDVQEIQ